MIKEYFNFPYELDTFQIDGCNSIANNENLLVTAHTGSGKTVFALYGIAKTLSEGKQVIYTSPIKTLSNQKYAEFSEHFSSIGIITGDVKINPLGELLIMTAEILRNSLFKNDNNIYEWNFNPKNIGCVILDEVHYINNSDRGKIWEEIIINLDPSIQLIMLSATISGAELMQKWIIELKNKNCNLVTTLKRPVPLKHGIWWDNNITYFLHGDTDWKNNIWNKLSCEINNYYNKKSYSLNMFFECIKYLFDNDMTPANIFLLNRKLIEEYAKKIPYYFVSSEVTSNIQNIWNNKLNKYNKIYEKSKEWTELYLLVSRGIGIHHSGMIPILKEIVELLYSQGYIKILLATETFALGVNMPTKTVVFTNLYKFDSSNKKRLLKPDEYNQMAGRAGRRGKDKIGHVIILPFEDFISEYDAQTIILSKPQYIISKLSIDPIFVLKYLANNNILLINNICNNTLFNYQEILNNNKYNDDIEYYKNELNNLNINDNMIIDFNKILEIEDKLKPNGYIKLSSKNLKILLNEKKLLLAKLNNNTDNIKKYINIKSKYDNLINNENNNNIINQINIIKHFLEEYNYINNNELTNNGIIISEINECNPFLLLNIINNIKFNNLVFSEIVAICSILINENKSKNTVYISDLNCSNECKELLNNVQNLSEKYYLIQNELNNKLPYPFWLDWTLDFSMFNNVKLWAEDKQWYEIVNENLVFQGTFIKTILRISNLLRNIEYIAKLVNNIHIINILYGYQEKILRDIVITDSLYI